MSNRFLGEATTTVDGKVYTLRCDFNAMCAFEDETGKDALVTFEKFEKGEVGVKDMRTIMWSFMQHHHPEVTMQEAGHVLSSDTAVLMKVIQAASPAPDEVQDLGNGAPKAAKKARGAA